MQVILISKYNLLHLENPVEADLALAGDRIVGVGDFGAQSAADGIDARGKLVTTGFVDIHTHYDGQAVWDKHMAPSACKSIAAMAEREGCTAPEVAYGILLEREGRGFIYTPFVNYANYDMSAPEEMLADKNAIMRLGDGGVHVGFILDVGYPTWLMSY